MRVCDIARSTTTERRLARVCDIDKGLLRAPSKDDRLYNSAEEDWFILPAKVLEFGVKIPLNWLFYVFFHYHHLAPSQLNINGWATMQAYIWHYSKEGVEHELDTLERIYGVSKEKNKVLGVYGLFSRKRGTKLYAIP